MTKILPLSPRKISGKNFSFKIPWADSSQIPLPSRSRPYINPFQPRAMEALDLALELGNHNYHVFLCGEPGSGRETLLKSWLNSRLPKRETPADLLYLQNFEFEDAPVLISLNPGEGKKVAKMTRKFLQDLQEALSEKLASPDYFHHRELLHRAYQKKRTALLGSLAEAAKRDGMDLRVGEDGEINLYPLSLTAREEKSGTGAIKGKKTQLSESTYRLINSLDKLETTCSSELHNLDRETARKTLHVLYARFSAKIKKNFTNQALLEYFNSLCADIEKNYPSLLFNDSQKEDNTIKPFLPPPSLTQHYGINVFVDNGKLNGAPAIWEDNPTLANLLGCFERETEMGALITNFALIRAGSLHKANGGFLIIHLNDLFEKQGSFENLLRILKAGVHRMEDSLDMPDTGMHPKTLHPEPVPLNLTVILIGSEEDYEYLLSGNERFAKLFRIKAHMASVIDRNPGNIRQFLVQVAQIIREEKLLPFSAEALAKICDLASWLCEDQRKLSLNFSILKDYLLEASALARKNKLQMVSETIMQEASERKMRRNDLLEKLFLEDYAREIVKLPTLGKTVGKVNALSVIRNGDFEFGLPHTISCAIGVGHDGIIDLERDAELSGPIHNKAMMILKSYLTARFANKNPIVLTGSLYFEQNYTDIEGDSASGAELAAIISAIARIPLRQDLAITGSVNQDGDILAVGGISAKVESFYKLCKMRGFSGTQGVIIPKDNLDHLFLSREIQEDVAKGNFFIYAIKNIEEALTLLTGMTIGKMRKNYSYTPGSLFAKVDSRLMELGAAYQHPFRGAKKTA